MSFSLNNTQPNFFQEDKQGFQHTNNMAHPKEEVYKVCLIGDGGTGKTTYINRVLNGDFIVNYEATHGAVTRSLTLPLNNGRHIKFEVWDTAGQEKNAGLRDGYFIGAHSAFFFFDVNSRETLANIPKHIEDFLRVCPNKGMKFFILANKIDLKAREVDLTRIRKKIPSYYEYEIVHVSAKTGQRFAEPFLKLARHLLKDNTIDFNLAATNSNFFEPLQFDQDAAFAFVADNQNVNMPSNTLSPDIE